jgi:hypothetical protein
VFLASIVPAILFFGVAYTVSGQAKLYFGLAAGGCLSLYIWFRDSPPAHIENRRTGSDGERRTAKALRPLEYEGWRAWHDIARPGGANFDHVLVGPPGIFLLDTKSYLGEARIENGEFKVRWLEDPEDGWTSDRLTSQMRGASVELKERIQKATGQRWWVQPLVVLWQRFPERVAEVVDPSSVCFVHGDELVSWLRAQPTQAWYPSQSAIDILEQTFVVGGGIRSA